MRRELLGGWIGLLGLEAVAPSDPVDVLSTAIYGFDDLGLADTESQCDHDVVFFSVERPPSGLRTTFEALQGLRPGVAAGHGEKLCHRSCNKTTCHRDIQSATLYTTWEA
jgi:hypothetical protein